MTIYCWKVGDDPPVVMKKAICVSIVETGKTYGESIIEKGYQDLYPEGATCKDKLFNVTAIVADGSMYTCYDVAQFEGE